MVVADAELRRLSFIPLLVVDEVGYIPFDPEAANLMFSLVSARYERASLIVTSNKPFRAWGDVENRSFKARSIISLEFPRSAGHGWAFGQGFLLDLLVG